MADELREKPLVQQPIVVEGPKGDEGPVGPPGGTGPAPSTFDSADVIYTNNGQTDVEGALDALFYVAPDITVFTNTVGNVEKGSTVNTVTLNWTLNKPDVISQTVTGTNISPTVVPIADRTVSLTSLALTTNGTWTLTIDDGTNTDADTTSVNFYNKVHFGAAVIPGSIDSAFILTLTGELRADRLKNFTVTPGASQYIWFAIPVAYGAATFTVGGFEGGFEAPVVVSHTNDSGSTEDYNVYRSTNSNLGNTTVIVS